MKVDTRWPAWGPETAGRPWGTCQESTCVCVQMLSRADVLLLLV